MRTVLKKSALSGLSMLPLVLGACGGPQPVQPAEAPSQTSGEEMREGAEAAPRFGTFGFDLSGMDHSIAPGDDFDRFANGAWADRTTIPADRARYGVFDMLTLETEAQVQALIEEAADVSGEPGSNEQLIGDLFSAWMDTDSIESLGAAPLAPLLQHITTLESHEAIAHWMGEREAPAVFGFGILPDPSDPTVYTVRFGQGGLGMPNREYYLDPSERFEEYRSAYLDYVRTLLELAGLNDAAARAERIMAFETALAESHWTRERSRQITETYNVLTIDALAELAPLLELHNILPRRGLHGVENAIVSQPSAVEAANRIVADADLQTLHDWLAFHTISQRATWLSSAFDEAHFHFYGRTLSGTEEMRPRERRGTQLVNGALGHAVGQVYVERHFPPESRALMEELVEYLTSGFRGRLEQLPWMDDETREEALAKLATFEPRIGYPEVWDTFEGLEIDPEDHFGNMERIGDHRWREQVARFPEPVDRRRWSWPPQIVNASYSPLMNQITFPAGILQAPFFDPAADAAINFGAIGAVIGHEIGHGFDDQGRRFDAQGRIRDWWTEETNALFEEAASRLADQYSAFCPIDDLCINGRLALGENIGDLGGMQMAYVAYRNYVAATYPDGEAPVLDGYTGDQRFFLAWAQVWRTLFRDDALRAQLVNGPHSPGRYRILGVVRNLDAWYDAFDVTEEHELYLPPEERVRIW